MKKHTNGRSWCWCGEWHRTVMTAYSPQIIEGIVYSVRKVRRNPRY